MRLTTNQIDALYEIGCGNTQHKDIRPRTRRALLNKNLIDFDLSHPHSNPGAQIEFLKLTPAGIELSKKYF